MRTASHPRRQAGPLGFTLTELLVVIALIGILAGMLLPALSRAKASARSLDCLNRMRQVSLAIRLYADDHGGEFPRSQHSAFAHGQPTWGRSIAPYLGVAENRWTDLLETAYRCPADRRPFPWSYGLNVYMELGPEDDYRGKPRTWRRMEWIPQPVDTILLAENATRADHVMAHFWSRPEDALDVDATRHRGRSNYSFVDGHGESRLLESTFAPPQVDLWNPWR